MGLFRRTDCDHGLQKHAAASAASSSSSSRESKRNNNEIFSLLNLMMMAICTLVGIAAGFAMSQSSTLTRLGSQNASSSSSSVVVVVASERTTSKNHSLDDHRDHHRNNANNASDDNDNGIHAHGIIGRNDDGVSPSHSHHHHHHGGGSVIDEIVLPSLRAEYATENLQFNVTRSMLRSSRPVVGNVGRLRGYLRKLRSGKCTTVVFIGGSVTAGHNGGGPNNAYPIRWMEWLNERYPCEDEKKTKDDKGGVVNNATTTTTTMGGNGGDKGQGKHEHVVLTGGMSSAAVFSLWSTVTSIEAFDLVLTEFNVNDSFIHDLPHALEDKGPVTSEYKQAWYFEAMLRRLLLLRKPDPVAVITFNADYVGRIWASPPYANPEQARKMLFRSNQEPIKNWVSSMYEVPVFSAVTWMLPLAGRKGRDWQFNRTANKYNTAAWHADACCHPPPKGHRLLSLILGYCLVEEERIMLSYGEHDTADEQRDFTADDASQAVLREPLYLSPEEDALYVQNDVEYNGFDFTDAGRKAEWEGAIFADDGWRWYADNKERDKHGYIADDVDGGRHVALSLVGSRNGRVEVSYVVSYENFGVALAWVDDDAENRVHNRTCAEEATGGRKTGPTTQLNAIWGLPASVPKVDILPDKLKEGEKKFLHLCLTKRKDDRKGAGNKFKLLGVRSF